LQYYKKRTPSKTADPAYTGDNIFFTFLIALATALPEQARRIWGHRRDMLYYISHCLEYYGLHPFIYLRGEKEKRFNIQIIRNYKKRTEETFTKIGLTYPELEKFFLIPYKNRRQIRWDNHLIKPSEIGQIKMTTFVFSEDELPLFAAKHRIRWTDNFKDRNMLLHACKDETDEYYPEPDKSRYDGKEIETSILKTTIKCLVEIPVCRALFIGAVDRLETKDYRNILDDMRVA
jgi:hypothetical protein